jgi:hypothetical protein
VPSNESRKYLFFAFLITLYHLGYFCSIRRQGDFHGELESARNTANVACLDFYHTIFLHGRVRTTKSFSQHG